MWMIELAMNTATAERRMGSHKDITGTIATSFLSWPDDIKPEELKIED
jgi:hypothetical protein